MTNMYAAFLILAIVAIIVVFFYTMYLLYRKINSIRTSKYIKEILYNSQYRNRYQESVLPHNDFLMRNKLREEKRQKELAEKGVTLYGPQDIEEPEEQVIVDIVKPVGFWSRFIMSQKLSFIRDRLYNKRSGNGRWVSFILAQQAARGFSQTKGRAPGDNK